jgi:hypothetical protein
MGAPHDPHVPHRHSPRPTPSVLRISLHRSRARALTGARHPCDGPRTQSNGDRRTTACGRRSAPSSAGPAAHATDNIRHAPWHGFMPVWPMQTRFLGKAYRPM